ncbi:hypothetical protein EDD22DRAFT_852882 [Suillus occidentalis]|nr:hypothetical protein EDD22DRAFT_852882 [Suillus occidentalis]
MGKVPVPGSTFNGPGQLPDQKEGAGVAVAESVLIWYLTPPYTAWKVPRSNIWDSPWMYQMIYQSGQWIGQPNNYSLRPSLWHPHILRLQSINSLNTPSSQTSFLQRLIRSRLHRFNEIEGDMNQHCIKPFSTPEVYRVGEYHSPRILTLQTFRKRATPGTHRAQAANLANSNFMVSPSANLPQGPSTWQETGPATQQAPPSFILESNFSSGPAVQPVVQAPRPNSMTHEVTPFEKDIISPLARCAIQRPGTR